MEQIPKSDKIEMLIDAAIKQGQFSQSIAEKLEQIAKSQETIIECLSGIISQIRDAEGTAEETRRKYHEQQTEKQRVIQGTLKYIVFGLASLLIGTIGLIVNMLIKIIPILNGVSTHVTPQG